jgi:hypothetical protein
MEMAKKARPRLKPTLICWLYARVETLASLRREFFRRLWSPCFVQPFLARLKLCHGTKPASFVLSDNAWSADSPVGKLPGTTSLRFSLTIMPASS